jgi:hypothetical protein
MKPPIRLRSRSLERVSDFLLAAVALRDDGNLDRERCLSSGREPFWVLGEEVGDLRGGGEFLRARGGGCAALGFAGAAGEALLGFILGLTGGGLFGLILDGPLSRVALDSVAGRDVVDDETGLLFNRSAGTLSAPEAAAVSVDVLGLLGPRDGDTDLNTEVSCFVAALSLSPRLSLFLAFFWASK